MSRTIRTIAVQTGPASADLSVNLRAVTELLADEGSSPDLIVLPELFALPFFCVGLSDPGFFSWAEDLEGPTVQAMRKLAQEHDTHVVVPFFERGRLAGEYYNSVVVVDPAGDLVPGRLPSGRTVAAYRKAAISSFRWDEQVNDEKFYFRPGSGYPVFPTSIGVLGLLICYDRWYPEAWRVLALQGAEVICVVNASLGDVSDLFVPSLRTCAAQNLVYVVATNRGGTEEIEGRRSRYYGLSCVIGPRGNVLAQAAEAAPNELASTDLDLTRVATDRTRQTMYRDRRPELYGLLADEGSKQ